MNKVELQAKADSLIDEVNFLRALYEAVRATVSFFEGKQSVQSAKDTNISSALLIFRRMGAELFVGCSLYHQLTSVLHGTRVL